MKRLFMVFALFMCMLIMAPIAKAATIDEIRVNSETYYVEEGTLPSYTATTTTEHASIEPYGSNTRWLSWGPSDSSWHGFGSETPTAVLDGETHYSLRLKVDLDDGYEFTNATKVYFNGALWDLGHTTVDANDWGGYVIIDLGTASVEPQFIVAYDFNGGTKDGKSTYVTQQVSYGAVISVETFVDLLGVEAPEGKELDYIEVNGVRYELDSLYMLSQNTTYRYIWKDAVATEKINTINLTVSTPEIGTTITDENVKPVITLESGANYKVSWTMFINNYPSVDPSYDSGEIFGSVITEGNWYYLEIYLMPNDGYIFDESSKVTLKVNGGTEYEIGYCADTQFGLFTKVQATKEAPKYEYKDGSVSSYDLSKDDVAVFSIDADYSLFQTGGSVYMDDKLVDSKYYTSEAGSTVIKFTKEFMNTLSAGAHTLKVMFGNGGSATTTFEVKNTSTTAGAANTTTTDTAAATKADSTAAATTATTTSTKNPKTLDGITIWSSLFVISLAGLATGLYSKKKFD